MRVECSVCRSEGFLAEHSSVAGRGGSPAKAVCAELNSPKHKARTPPNGLSRALRDLSNVIERCHVTVSTYHATK